MNSPLVLHPDLEPYAFMLGTWRGEGEGSYPTIDDFRYWEEIVVGHGGKPFMVYSQRTRDAVTDLPLHVESGYWRFPGPVELVIAHPTGILESLSGSFAPSPGGGRFELSSRAVVLTETAKSVTETTRSFTFDGDTVHYDMAMAAVGLGLTHHLSATLHRA